MNLSQAGRRKSRRRGFTLVEVMVVVVIIGLLAVIALPAFKRARMNTQNSRFVSDLRMFVGACETFALENGVFPGDGNSGVLPNGLEAYIKPTDFEVQSPIGGSWDTEFNDSSVTFAVGAVDITIPDEQLTLIDEMLDDGDINNGTYRLIRANGYYRVLEE